MKDPKFLPKFEPDKRDVRYICHRAEGATVAEAAKRVGFRDPERQARSLERQPRVRQIIEESRARIITDVLEEAVRQHHELLVSKDTPASARVAAIKLAYDVGLRDPNVDPSRRDISEMSAGEINNLIEKLEHAASEQAKPVNAAPLPATPFD